MLKINRTHHLAYRLLSDINNDFILNFFFCFFSSFRRGYRILWLQMCRFLNIVTYCFVSVRQLLHILSLKHDYFTNLRTNIQYGLIMCYNKIKQLTVLAVDSTVSLMNSQVSLTSFAPLLIASAASFVFWIASNSSCSFSDCSHTPKKKTDKVYKKYSIYYSFNKAS